MKSTSRSPANPKSGRLSALVQAHGTPARRTFSRHVVECCAAFRPSHHARSKLCPWPLPVFSMVGAGSIMSFDADTPAAGKRGRNADEACIATDLLPKASRLGFSYYRRPRYERPWAEFDIPESACRTVRILFWPSCRHSAASGKWAESTANLEKPPRSIAKNTSVPDEPYFSVTWPQRDYEPPQGFLIASSSRRRKRSATVTESIQWRPNGKRS